MGFQFQTFRVHQDKTNTWWQDQETEDSHLELQSGSRKNTLGMELNARTVTQ